MPVSLVLLVTSHVYVTLWWLFPSIHPSIMVALEGAALVDRIRLDVCLGNCLLRLLLIVPLLLVFHDDS